MWDRQTFESCRMCGYAKDGLSDLSYKKLASHSFLSSKTRMATVDHFAVSDSALVERDTKQQSLHSCSVPLIHFIYETCMHWPPSRSDLFERS